MLDWVLFVKFYFCCFFICFSIFFCFSLVFLLAGFSPVRWFRWGFIRVLGSCCQKLADDQGITLLVCDVLELILSLRIYTSILSMFGIINPIWLYVYLARINKIDLLPFWQK